MLYSNIQWHGPLAKNTQPESYRQPSSVNTQTQYWSTWISEDYRFGLSEHSVEKHLKPFKTHAVKNWLLFEIKSYSVDRTVFLYVSSLQSAWRSRLGVGGWRWGAGGWQGPYRWGLRRQKHLGISNVTFGKQEIMLHRVSGECRSWPQHSRCCSLEKLEILHQRQLHSKGLSRMYALIRITKYLWGG